MPKRPVQHQIETRSRTLWERLIPDQWLFRPESPDYGIDGSIEIFDVGGAATGHRFLVQLKGTTRLSEGDLPPRAVPHPMLVPAPVEGREGRASSGTRATA